MAGEDCGGNGKIVIVTSFSREREGGDRANPAITDSFLPILFQGIGKLNPTILHRNSTELIIGINISLDHNLSRLIPSRAERICSSNLPISIFDF